MADTDAVSADDVASSAGADNRLAVATYRLERNIQQLVTEVDKLDVVSVPAAAADFLDALYGFTRLFREALIGQIRFDELCASSPDGHVVEGLTYLRGQGVHQAVSLSKLDGRTAEYFYGHYECWSWTPDVPLTGSAISQSYQQYVADHEVRVTLAAIERFRSSLTDLL